MAIGTQMADAIDGMQGTGHGRLIRVHAGLCRTMMGNDSSRVTGKATGDAWSTTTAGTATMTGIATVGVITTTTTGTDVSQPVLSF